MADHNDVERCGFLFVHQQAVDEVLGGMPDDETLYDLAELFKVFGEASAWTQPNRSRFWRQSTGIREYNSHDFDSRNLYSFYSELACYYPLLERKCVYRKGKQPKRRTRT